MVNRSSQAHTLTSVSGAFDTGPVAEGGRATFRAPAPGSYPFSCTYFPTMTGTLVVTVRG